MASILRDASDRRASKHAATHPKPRQQAPAHTCATVSMLVPASLVLLIGNPLLLRNMNPEAEPPSAASALRSVARDAPAAAAGTAAALTESWTMLYSWHVPAPAPMPVAGAAGAVVKSVPTSGVPAADEAAPPRAEVPLRPAMALRYRSRRSPTSNAASWAARGCKCTARWSPSPRAECRSRSTRSHCAVRAEPGGTRCRTFATARWMSALRRSPRSAPWKTRGVCAGALGAVGPGRGRA